MGALLLVLALLAAMFWLVIGLCFVLLEYLVCLLNDAPLTAGRWVKWLLFWPWLV